MQFAETITLDTSNVIALNILCLDFWTKRVDYQNELIPFFEKNRAALALEHSADLFESYIEKVWPHELPGSMIMAYASFDGFERYIFRPPVDGPLADGFAANGIVPALVPIINRGH